MNAPVLDELYRPEDAVRWQKHIAWTEALIKTSKEFQCLPHIRTTLSRVILSLRACSPDVDPLGSFPDFSQTEGGLDL